MKTCADIDGVMVVSTTELSNRLGLKVPASLLIDLGLRPFAVMPNGMYWAADNIDEIRERLAHFIKEGPLVFFESYPC